jgi:hypothetical protein
MYAVRFEGIATVKMTKLFIWVKEHRRGMQTEMC